MPRKITEKVGEIHRTRTVQTLGDQVKEFLQVMAGLAIIGGIVFLALS